MKTGLWIVSYDVFNANGLVESEVASMPPLPDVSSLVWSLDTTVVNVDLSVKANDSQVALGKTAEIMWDVVDRLEGATVQAVRLEFGGLLMERTTQYYELVTDREALEHLDISDI